ncbi:alcohol dehydrogenase catalytic domain-containing protein [Pseudomonas syringae]|uniref:alcohol dehydrogenase catalytic domain-containing protein n=1 Tax=Pseudomonas syringae TaxID=317 RepID=UPI002E36EE13|nr:alcohol dehydrogenase catalytic domain-containing protein [Pseudomonas syringae]
MRPRSSRGFTVLEAKGNFKRHEFTRGQSGDDGLLYSGICHGDVHKVRDDWKAETYPVVPGHESAGRVVQVGCYVNKFQVDDYREG